jgi:hypothetical protein
MRSIRLPATILLGVSLAGSFSVLPRTFHWSQQESQQHPPAQIPELHKLDAWSGRWTSQGKLYDTPYSHAGSITITMTCAWSAYNGYMICDHLFNGPAGMRNDLTVYTYNPVDKSYKFYSVDQSGAPRSVPLTIAGDIWTYNNDMEKDGKKILIRTVNDFSKPGIVTWNTKFSDDAGSHWTLMNEGVDTKVR